MADDDDEPQDIGALQASVVASREAAASPIPDSDAEQPPSEDKWVDDDDDPQDIGAPQASVVASREAAASPIPNSDAEQPPSADKWMVDDDDAPQDIEVVASREAAASPIPNSDAEQPPSADKWMVDDANAPQDIRAPQFSVATAREAFSASRMPNSDSTEILLAEPSEQGREHKDPRHFRPAGINLPGFLKTGVHVPTPYAATKPPKKTLQAVYNAGRYKAALTLDVLALQSFMAGIYIAMAGHLFLSVGGGVLGAALFPTGLIAVVLASGELFTGDALIFIASLLGKQVKIRSLLRNWTVSWIFNFFGCLVWAALLGYCSDSLEDVGQADYAIAVARKKAFQPWINIFLKAIGANFMVCVGVWQATCAEEVAGKIFAIWFPIAGFVMMGFDHCIANQFLIPLGMMLGANDISVARLLFQALLPATLGNILGGGLMVGAVYWYVFDSMENFNGFRTRMNQTWNRSSRRIKSWPSVRHFQNLNASGDEAV